ncbi:NACHT, LRR and PYD domains-containing protein 3-like isoform X2 [Simochromis diagramma]|uniref:NACHT, LRR and PYD domains-containing protein 3-like isoform X2 n=1 Tax=Simochromis diagramma TaxID=43689 RepID=UPI001A7F0575|nr:NACHT, LRR and PYD domains-containing protein 3-like isoform X2 [Simochromis diagramma]
MSGAPKLCRRQSPPDSATGNMMSNSTREELLLRALKDLGDNELKEFKWYLQKSDVLERFPIIPKSRLDKADRPDTVDQMLQTYCENVLEVTKKVLRKLDRNDLVQILIDPNAEPEAEGFAEFQKNLKSNLMKKFQESAEKLKGGKSKLQNETYTEVCFKIENSQEVNKEHEIRLIEKAHRKPDRPETRLRCEDIFKASPIKDKPIRTVLTKGMAGIGKTVSTQKFTLDWAKDKANQDIHLTFLFTFREVNVLEDKKFSLVELVNHFFTKNKEAGICSFEGFKVVFIFDGLDECRFPLDFHKTAILTDATESTSVSVLLTNLIRGDLLPSARLWITTRPAAANQIPSEYVNIVTEVMGFTDAQKLDYFRKKFRDEKLIGRMISHIKTSQSLNIMCHIPVFCCITATVLEDMLKTKEKDELPKTLTEMYIHLLISQAKVKKVKHQGGTDADPQWNQASKEMILSLGKLAFEQLQKANLIFYESDLKDCGISVTSASVYAGLFTEIFKEERVLRQDKVFSFIHLSVQEFLAALYVHMTFFSSGLNLLDELQQSSWISRLSRSKSNLHQRAVDKALQSPNGHLDLFLRFLLGLSLETNQILLQGLLRKTGSSSQETVQYIKERLDDGLPSEKSINLFHCLNEVNDHSLLEDIQKSLSSGNLYTNDLFPSQWSALVFILLSSENLDVFDLKKYSASEEVLLKLLPVVKASNKALLSSCNLSEKSVKILSPVLSSQSSCLRELDLSNNNLEDSGVKMLSTILEGPHCQLETLRLIGCNLSWRSCETLSTVISTQSLNLKELDVSNNDLQDSGVQLLSAGLESNHCVLQTLRLSGCQVTEQGCAALASALSSNPSHLRELDLSYNHPGDQGVTLLSFGLKDRQCQLETLRLDHCGEQRLKPGLRKYFCGLELDPNTAHRNLKLSDDNKKVTVVKEEQPYPNHPERFDYCCWQVLCKNGLTGRCYWEVEREGQVVIAVTYKRISRKGNSADCRLGWNDQCWSLICTQEKYSFWHNKREHVVYLPYGATLPKRIAVYVDCPAGTVSFYQVCSDKLTLLHTFHTTFTEPVYPAFGFGFGFWSYESTASLCEL